MNTAPDQVRRHRLSVADYHLMGEAGVFGVQDRVELIDGELFDMTPVGNRHVSIVDRLTERFVLAVTGRAIVRVQNPVRLGDRSEPAPDLCLLRRRDDFYGESPQRAEDVLLVIEVADSSLRHDRDVKMPLYARHGIPEAWLIDVSSRQLTVFRTPGPDGYRDESIVSGTEPLDVLMLPGVSLDPTGLL